MEIPKTKITLLFIVFSLWAGIGYAQSPPDLKEDINWQGSGSLYEIQTAFNWGRRVEERQWNLPAGTLGNLVLPHPKVWDSFNESEKAFFLINSERIARGGVSYDDIIPLGLPLERVHPQLNKLAQAHAYYLVAANTTGHIDGNEQSPFDRIENDPHLGPNHEFLPLAENISYFFTRNHQNELLIPRAVYQWIYCDKDNSFMHRRACLLQNMDWMGRPIGFSNNYGSRKSEGLMGIGVSGAFHYNPFGKKWVKRGDVVVFMIADPKAHGFTFN